jgi:hypothetical protein
MVCFMPRMLYPQGKSPQYPVCRMLSGRQSQSGRHGEVNMLDPTGTILDPPVIQAVASRYIDCGIVALIVIITGKIGT